VADTRFKNDTRVPPFEAKALRRTDEPGAGVDTSVDQGTECNIGVIVQIGAAAFQQMPDVPEYRVDLLLWSVAGQCDAGGFYLDGNTSKQLVVTSLWSNLDILLNFALMLLNAVSGVLLFVSNH